MAFYSCLKIPKSEELEKNKNFPIIFLKKLVKPWQSCQKGTALAILEHNEKNYNICVTYAGVVDKFVVDENEKVQVDEEFCKYIAEGEDIPYGKPYVFVRSV